MKSILFPFFTGPTIAPTVSPTVTAAITDQMIFGYDVGSTVGNVVVLICLILVILWLGLSMAYCISRGDPKTEARGRSKKSRRQKFEEYWGDVDESAHSTTGLNPSDHRGGSARDDDDSQHSTDMSFNGLMSIPLGGDGRRNK